MVTQDFHLPRAVYLCRRLGIEAVWQAVVTRPEPHFLGPHETQLDAVLAGNAANRSGP